METKPRFVEATWGGETSTNEYGYCENVIMIGILHRNDHDLAAEIIGEQDDPLADLSDLYDIKKSEIAHSVYQRSEEHTSELQSLMRISYAVFCLKKKKKTNK